MKAFIAWVLVGMAMTGIVVVAQGTAGFQARPVGTLKQVMRGIPYPNSEILFAVQNKAPQSDDGWKTVQNAAIAIAIAEAGSLITMPGRLKEDGSRVPVQKADWKKYARGLVTAAQGCYQASLAKNRSAVVKCTDGLAEACSNCHDVYRDAPHQTPGSQHGELHLPSRMGQANESRQY